jgi:hypothetical protein
MKNLLIVFSMIFASNAMAVCSSPISRTNFSALQVLTATRLNTDLNAAYARANELPGDCVTDETITSAKILNGTIVSADIANATIVNANISTSAAIASSKLAAPNLIVSSTNSGDFSTTSTSFVDVTNVTASITTTGKPVIITFYGDDATNACRFGLNSPASLNTNGEYKLLRGATQVGLTAISLSGASGDLSRVDPCGIVSFYDPAPPAGTYTYKLQAKANFGAIYAGYVKMLVREL